MPTNNRLDSGDCQKATSTNVSSMRAFLSSSVLMGLIPAFVKLKRNRLLKSCTSFGKLSAAPVVEAQWCPPTFDTRYSRNALSKDVLGICFESSTEIRCDTEPPAVASPCCGMLVAANERSSPFNWDKPSANNVAAWPRSAEDKSAFSSISLAGRTCAWDCNELRYDTSRSFRRPS